MRINCRHFLGRPRIVHALLAVLKSSGTEAAWRVADTCRLRVDFQSRQSRLSRRLVSWTRLLDETQRLRADAEEQDERMLLS